MSRKLSIAFFLHSIRSDWNNGNAHFLRGLLRSLGRMGHRVITYEREHDWSVNNLLLEGERGRRSLEQFREVYPELEVRFLPGTASGLERELDGFDLMIVHEWNTPELIDQLLGLRDRLGLRALFHDTHHRASSSPEAIAKLQVARFDGVIVFGRALQQIYERDFGLSNISVLHEAADISVFHPADGTPVPKQDDVVWIGNWGDDERSREIRSFLVEPAAALPDRHFTLYGVRYPPEALDALAAAGVAYGGYLPNLDAPAAYHAARLTVHIPRQQYAGAMTGIPTIRVFEALACGIPLVSAPWHDTEELFRPGDLLFVESGEAMRESLEYLLSHPAAAQEQARRGLETVLARHTCDHRARELTAICEEVLAR